MRAVPGRRPARKHDVSVRRAPDTGDYIPSLQNRGERVCTDVRADERAEEDGRLAVAEDVAAVPLVNVEVPATGWYRRGHVGEHPDCVHDPAMAVGDQIPQHVLDGPLAHAAAKVDVGGMGPGSDPAGVDGNGQRVAVGVVGDGGPSPRRAIADTARADFDRDKPVRPQARAAQPPGLSDRLPGDAAALHPHADHQAAPARQMAGEVALKGAVGLADAIGSERAEPDSPGPAGHHEIHIVRRAGREPEHVCVDREVAMAPPAEGDRPGRHCPQGQVHNSWSAMSGRGADGAGPARAGTSRRSHGQDGCRGQRGRCGCACAVADPGTPRPPALDAAPGSIGPGRTIDASGKAHFSGPFFFAGLNRWKQLS